ncbi:MAG TPA: response regulator [Tepidisphaeraceae bacterium]|nr:response regulator [Tepidisphaeraceae bacterium]
MQILVVDDSKFTRDLLIAGLKRLGHDVASASGGKMALRMISSNHYRLVISDWEMPDMDGLALCRAVRNEVQNHVYFALMSAHDNLHRAEGLAAGADAFLSKPCSLGELGQVLAAAQKTIESAI